MSLYERLDKAATSAACDFLTFTGGALINSAVWNIGGPKAIAARVGIGGASLLASRYLCADMPVGESPDPQPGECQKVDGYGTLYGLWNGVWEVQTGAPDYQAVTEIIFWEQFQEPGQAFNARLVYKTFSGAEQTYLHRTPGPDGVQTRFKIVTDGNGSCADQPDVPNPPLLPTEPYEYFDESVSCTYNVSPLGFADNSPSGGNPGIAFLIEAAPSGAVRASGGRIGGCNFEPTIYFTGGGGGGNGPVYLPAPPDRDDDDGVPWWAKALLAGAAGAAINQVLDALLPGGDALVWEDTDYAIQGICEPVAPGDMQPILSTPVAGGDFGPAVINRLDALTILLQYHLSLKTPICAPEKPTLEGTWISSRWISDGNSPGGERPLRKLFRYRSKSARTDEQLREYWSDFTWQAGSVCVIHQGAWWGTPQVWASTEEEGRRIIRFAAAEAGIDPDQTGEWTTSSSRSARYGMSGTMRLEAPNGTRWVTRREGPSSVPV